MTESFDIIVVGAGSAGSIVAARVSEDADCRVLLIEAGPPARSWTIRMPANYGANFLGGTYNWRFETVPQKGLDGRSVFTPRGRALGGSSSINGMIYMRGHALDFDRWEKEGAAGWSYASVLPYFKRLERYDDGGDDWRGGDGPVSIVKAPVWDKLSEAFLAAGEELGHGVTPQFNGEHQEGFFRYDLSIERGVRASTAHAYLDPAADRPNLTVRPGMLVLGLELERGRAVGVRVAPFGGGPVETWRAEREIVLAAGVVGSPQLLMLSGIGPADHLKSLGIGVVHDLPGVGQNLQDHLYLQPTFSVTEPVSIAPLLKPVRKTLTGLQWFLSHSGPASTNHCHTGAVLKTGPHHEHGDMQIHFRPVLLENYRPTPVHGMTPGIGTLRAKSHGELRLASADAREAPLIDPAYLVDPDDVIDLRRTVEITREIMAARSFQRLGVRELQPGPEIRTAADIDAYVRAEAGSAYHPVGTCRMGADGLAVVDSDARVRGIEGLRVADASIMPSLTSGNTNAPAMMIGEKVADLVRGRPALPPLRPASRAQGDRRSASD